MRKQALKRLVLSRETLRTLSSQQARGVVGANPTDASACKMAGSCRGEGCTNDPELCAPSWVGNCVTYTC